MRKLFAMGKANYKKRELMDNEQDALLEYKELVGAHNAGKKKWYKKYLNRKYRRKDKMEEVEFDEEI
jgi:hypothetical protein